MYGSSHQPFPNLPMHIRVLNLDYRKVREIECKQLLQRIEPLHELQRLELFVDEGMKKRVLVKLEKRVRKEIELVVRQIEVVRFFNFNAPKEFWCTCFFCLEDGWSLRIEHPYIAKKGFAVRDYS